jgi:hypothetical protein
VLRPGPLSPLTLVTYTLPIPINLPPAYRGKAFRFSYDLVVSVNVALPGKGNKQRNKEVQVPIRIWANVSCLFGQ